MISVPLSLRHGRGGPSRPARPSDQLGRTSVAGAAFAGVTLLAGCTVATADGVVVAQAAEGERTPVAAAAAPSPMSKEIMYKVLVAELAGRRGDLQLALSSYLEVVRATRDAGAAERAVRIAVFARDEARGVEAARLWTEVAPDNTEARQVHAALLLRTGKTELASAELLALAQALEAESPGRGYNRVAEILAREKERETAILVMERVVDGHPDDPRAQFAFATLLARHSQFERALEVFDRVLELEPDNEEALIVKGRILYRERDPESALALLDGALQRQPDAARVRLAYARMLVDAKRYEDARGEFERLAADDPDDTDVQYALGLLLVQTNRLADAAERFRTLIHDPQRRESAWFYLGQIAESEKDLDEALGAYRRVDRGEHRLNAQIRVAVLLAEQGDVPKARAHLHGLRGDNSREAIRIYRAEAEILSRRDRLEDAMAVYDAALVEFAEETDLLYARAMLAEKLDRLESLERDLRDILSREPNNADALNALGYTLADRTDRLEEAHDLIKRAYDLKPDDHYVADSMGWVLYRMGKYTEALKYLRQAMSISPDPEVAAHLGEVLWVMGNHDEAREVWDTALKETPDDKKLLDVKKRFGL